MKRLLFILVSFCSLVVFNACSSDDKPIEDLHVYYVQYEVRIGDTGSFSQTWITYSTEYGVQTITEKPSKKIWEGTFGPFKKGDKIILEAKSSIGWSSVSAKIAVCRDQEPFVVKKEQKETNFVSLEYVIDY